MLKDQGTDIHNLYQCYFHFFSTDQTLNYPEFVDWCADNYSLSKRLIMYVTSSKIPCPVNSLVIIKSLLVPDEFTLKSKDYNEESIIQCFSESVVEKKREFLKKCFKLDVELLDQPFIVDSFLDLASKPLSWSSRSISLALAESIVLCAELQFPNISSIRVSIIFFISQ